MSFRSDDGAQNVVTLRQKYVVDALLVVTTAMLEFVAWANHLTSPVIAPFATPAFVKATL